MDLYYPPRPKSKLEEYNLKLKEREFYTNNILDRFSQNGSGAPLKDEKGNVITKRKAILENIKSIDDNVTQSQNRRFNYNNEENDDENNNFNNNNYNNQNEENNEPYNENENYSLKNTLDQNRLNSNNNSQLILPNQQKSINNFNINNNSYNLINNQIEPEKRNISAKNKKNNIITKDEEEYKGIGINKNYRL